MSSQVVYKVLTEFRFETAAAIAGSQQLQSEIGRISNAADQAILKLGGVGSAFLSSVGVNLAGGITGSLFSIVENAITSSEKFRDAQLSIANVLSANKDSFSGDVETFTGRLNTARSILKDIVADSRNFGIDEFALLDTTKLLGAQLAPKGLAGENFDVPRELARNLLKSAPNLGVHPAEVGGQLQRIIEGAASRSDTLFRRLSAETKAFAPFKGVTKSETLKAAGLDKKIKAGTAGTKAFNSLDTAKRLEILRKGLGQFSSDVDVLAGRFNTLTGQMQRTKSLLSGVDGVFRKIGDTLKAPIVSLMKTFNDELQQFGPGITDAINRMLIPHFKSPETLFTQLFQAKRAKQDLADAGGMAARIGIVQTVQFGLSKLFKTSKLLHPAITGVWVAFDMLRSATDRANNPLISLVSYLTVLGAKISVIGGLVFVVAARFGKLAMIGNIVSIVLRKILAPLALLTFFQQVLSRAQAKALIADAKALPGTILRFTEAVATFKENLALIMLPIEILMEGLANLIAPFMGVNNASMTLLKPLELLNAAMSSLATVVVSALAGIDAFFEGIFGLALQAQQSGMTEVLKHFFTGNIPGAILAAGEVDTSKFNFGKIGEDMASSFRNFVINAGDRPGEQGGVATSNQTTNIGKVEIRNDFKENMEPDRIAHSLMKTIMSAAKNPTQSTGRSLNTSFAGG